MRCTFAAISAPCRVARPHNVVLDVNFYKGFWPVFIFRCLDMTPAWRLFLSHVIHGNSYRAKQQSSRAPSFAGNHPPCELVDCCGWPQGCEPLCFDDCLARTISNCESCSRSHHFSSTSLSSNIVPWLWHRLCVDTLLHVYTHNVMMDEPSFDGWAPLSGCCGLGSVIKGSNLLLSI